MTKKRKKKGIVKKDLVVLWYCDNEALLEVVDMDMALAECNVHSKFPAEKREFSVDLKKGLWSYKDAYGDETCQIGNGTTAWSGSRSRPRAVLGVFNRNNIQHLDHLVEHVIRIRSFNS
jgi:hypothetical protein